MERANLVVIATALFLLGCGQPVSNSLPVNHTVPRDRLSSSAGAAGTQLDSDANQLPTLDVTLELVDIAGFDRQLAARKGKVVLVDYWASWCAPCVKKFPETVELFQKYHASDLEVISVSLDGPEEATAVLEFLRQNKAEFTNFLHRGSGDATGFDQHKIDGGIPFFKLYDRTGKLRYRFSLEPEEIEDCESVDHIDVRTRELLAE